MRFQVLFHSPLGVLFTFPSRYWFAIGHQGVFSLRRWASQIHTGFLVSRTTWDRSKEVCASFVYGAITLYGSACPAGIRLEDRFVTSPRVRILSKLRPATPHAQQIRPLTYARFGLIRFRSPLLTKSLFAFSSSRYLDVSIPSVRLPDLCIQPRIAWVCQAGFPHSEIHG